MAINDLQLVYQKRTGYKARYDLRPEGAKKKKNVCVARRFQERLVESTVARYSDTNGSRNQITQERAESQLTDSLCIIVRRKMSLVERAFSSHATVNEYRMLLLQKYM